MTNILGIDIGGSGIKGAPVDTMSGLMLGRRIRIDTPQPATPARLASVVRRIIRHFEWNGPIGCAFPAKMKAGTAVTASNIDASWIGVHVPDFLEDATGLPVWALNDADAAGMAELRFGAARHAPKQTLVLTVGTGVGSSLLMDGNLVQNTELGHLIIHGITAESYISNRVRKSEGLTWQQWAGRLQEYLEYVEFLFDLDLIVLGGGISNPSRRAEYFGYLRTCADLVTAQLRNEAGIVGAAVFAAERSNDGITVRLPRRPIGVPDPG